MGLEKLNLSSIDVVDEISHHDFLEHYLLPGKPLKMRGFSKNWPALFKWTYPYLRQKLGNYQVKLYGNWLENEPARIEMPPVMETSFSAYIDIIESGMNSDLRLFLFNPFKLEPSLRHDFSFPDIVDGYIKNHPYMFFGSAGSDVRLHYDIDLSHVFITQFGGTKRFVLFDQKQTKYLYKVPFATHSAADLRQPDFEKFPALHYAKGYACELNHGETLFMPSGFWHYIQYIDSSFSLSLRSVATSHLSKMKGLYNLFFIRKLDNYLSKYYGQHWGDYKLRKAIERTNGMVAHFQK
jgi:hypothetical protein